MTDEEKSTAVQIGRRLAAARTLADLTQQQLAERIGVTAGTVRRWELGHASPPADTLLRLCRALGAEPGWVLDVVG